MVQSFVYRLSNDSEKNKVAKDCILRIADPVNTFTDAGSDISLRELLALTFSAIQDDEKRISSVEDAGTQFVEGLYEIQRGYNLSEAGEDQGGEDQFICSTGTLNKPIEKLVSIHPDCEIRFITRETASLKLPIVVREEAMRYMKSLASPNTEKDLQTFTHLISQVKEDGVEVVWDQIKGKVADRLFDEFGSLYRDREDHSFTGLIEAGQYTELPDLSIFQEQVQSSKGYHQFYSQMLRQSGLFSSPKKSADFLSMRRHDSPEDQKKYDQQFGLVLRNP